MTLQTITTNGVTLHQGDLVEMLPEANTHYQVTRSGWRGFIVEVDSDEDKIVVRENVNLNDSFPVNANYVKLVYCGHTGTEYPNCEDQETYRTIYLTDKSKFIKQPAITNYGIPVTIIGVIYANWPKQISGFQVIDNATSRLTEIPAQYITLTDNLTLTPADCVAYFVRTMKNITRNDRRRVTDEMRRYWQCIQQSRERIRQYTDRHRKLKTDLQAIKSKPVKNLQTEIELIKRHKLVTDCYFNTDGGITVLTDMLYQRLEATNKFTKVKLGRYIINYTIPGNIWAYGRDYRYGRNDHPHINSYGYICYGRLANGVKAALARYDYYIVTDTTIDLFNTLPQAHGGPFIKYDEWLENRQKLTGIKLPVKMYE